MNKISIEQIYKRYGINLELEFIVRGNSTKKMISSIELNRPGLALAGFYTVFVPNRIQIFGNTEISYISSLNPKSRFARLHRLFKKEIPCVIITADQETEPTEVLQVARETGVPLLRSRLPSTRFISKISEFLISELSPTVNQHGVLLDVFGMGLLIIGKSGVGKSEIAIEMIQRGHRLVADDIVRLRRTSGNQVVGRSSDKLGFHMEVRGVGIIDVERLFGEDSVVFEKQISLVVNLHPFDPGTSYDRLGIEDRTITLLDCDLPYYDLPIEAGRNVAALLEVAALNQRLKNTGVNSAKELNQRLIEAMEDEEV